MLGIFQNLFDSNKKVLKQFQPIVDEVNSLEEEMKKMSQEDMTAELDKYREEIKVLIDKVPAEDKSSLNAVDRSKEQSEEETAIQNKLLEVMPRVYAMVRELMGREFERRHYDVQILAGAILAQGQKLTELKTGEGKTQVFHLPLSLYGLTKRGAHAVTVNDYLAKRDGEYAGHFLSKLGYTVGVITPEGSYRYGDLEDIKKYKSEDEYKKAKESVILNPGDVDGHHLIPCTKKDAYDCDIVYGTNNEFGFDYLRDNMAFNLESLAQRELYFCIVDEADSILIDEARTPLIISAPAEESNNLYTRFSKVVPKLKKEEDYTIDEKARSVVLTDKGIEKMEGLLGVENIWEDYKLAHHLDNALKAETLYKKDKEYLVKDGQVMIIDQFTGRVLPGRRYSEGLHQAIEAKEGVEIKRESKTLATITFQNFFRLYKFLNGASGTIMTEAGEFYKIYNLESVEVPTNKPVIRNDMTDRVYKNHEAKFNAVAKEIMRVNETGQPILVGTASVEDSEYLSKLLDKEGVKHEVLNAKHHERESKIVAEAGRKGSVTVATNMAGRGTDIKLGGQNASKEAKQEILDLGGLCVIATERHEARRVDNQLRGRSGRQGEPGATRFFVSLDDEIMRIQGGGMVQKIMQMTNLPEDLPIESGLIGNSIENAQKKVEGRNFDIRKRLVEYDTVMNQQREIFYSRRRTTLENSEHAKGKFWQGRDVIIDDDEKKRKKYEDKIKENLRSFLEDEITSIVNRHFFTERDDHLDVKKLVEDVLDLTPDQFIVEALKDSEVKIQKNTIVNDLTNLLKEKKEDEIIRYLQELFSKVADKKFESYGKDIADVSKAVILQSMDQLWTDHIESMQDLREGIGLRGYAQREPLVEYKNEAFIAFEKFIGAISSSVARRILKMVKVRNIPQDNSVVINTNSDQISDITTGSREMTNALKDTIDKTSKRLSNQKSVKKVVKAENNKFKDVGRNDPCPCGSGKKFKKCHGKNS